MGEWGIIIGFPTGRHKKQKDLPAPKSTDKSHHLKQSQEENKFSGHVVDLTTTGVDYSLIVTTIIAPTKEIVKRFLNFFYPDFDAIGGFSVGFDALGDPPKRRGISFGCGNDGASPQTPLKDF